MDTTENFTKLMNYSGLQKQKIIRVKSQANECPSVSAAQSKLLPKDTTENVTTLIYSGLQKNKKNIKVKSQAKKSPCFCCAR